MQIRLWLLRIVRRDKVMYIGGSDTLPQPLTRAEEAELIARMGQGDFSVRQTLIERNLRLVVYLARRFENTGINMEDLISIGTIGLIKAINTFRADKNIKLATYASRCIENEILMYLRKNSAQRTEISFDEPLSTDWDGKELLLSDVLGTDGDTVMRPIEADVDRKLLQDAVEAVLPRAGHYLPTVRPGRKEGDDAEGGGRQNGHISVVHFPTGKAHHPAAEAGNTQNELKKVPEQYPALFTIQIKKIFTPKTGRQDG